MERRTVVISKGFFVIDLLHFAPFLYVYRLVKQRHIKVYANDFSEVVTHKVSAKESN